MRSLLVFDEVHASDAYMERLLTHLLEQHALAGGYALPLSATLGSAARTRLLGGKVSEIPDIAKAANAVPCYLVGLETTRRLILRYSEWRIPEMNRLLVENATHPSASP